MVASLPSPAEGQELCRVRHRNRLASFTASRRPVAALE